MSAHGTRQTIRCSCGGIEASSGFSGNLSLAHRLTMAPKNLPCCSILEGTDVLPPVCLAMPPRPLQGTDLTAAPKPWEGDALHMFSFAPCGRYYGWDVSRVQSWYDDIAALPAFDSTNTGSGNSNSTDVDGANSDADSTTHLTNTPVLTIPCPDGGHAVARFMAAGYFQADVSCWQCSGLFEGLQRMPDLPGCKLCSCTSCRCHSCRVHKQPYFTCPR